MRIYIFFIVILGIAACHSKKDSPENAPRQPPVISPDSSENFFPVTRYLKGEISGIKTAGITPQIKTTIGGKTDSSWLREADYEKEFAEFISPEIDTANLKNLFTETRFRDQTLDAFTMTCDPISGKADSFPFRHWDTYVDPNSNKVKRIYLVKQLANGKMLQLTWQSGKWCKIVTLQTTGDHTAIEKEEKISWSYDKE